MIAKATDQLTPTLAEQLFREHGWGPLRSWPIPRADRRPLVFQIRLPLAMELVDVPGLARRARGAPAAVAQGAAELEQIAEPAGLVLIGALRPTTVPEAEREILATLTVAFSEIDGSLATTDFRAPDAEDKPYVEVTRVSDRVTLITRVSLESLGADTEPIPMLVMQYLLETRYGALVMAFSTANQEMMGRWARKLYLRIVETIFIGERSQPR